MKLNWKITVLTGLLTFTYGFYLWGIPAILNSKLSENFIESEVYKISGYKIDLSKPRFSTGALPSIWLKTESFSLLNDNGSKALFLEKAKIKMNIIPLLFKQIEINKMSAKKENINLVLSKDKKFYIGQYPIKLNKNPQLNLTKLNMDLGEYSIYLDDKLNNKNVLIKGQYLKNGKYIKDKSIQCNTKGTFQIDKYLSTPYMIDAEINLPLNNFTGNQIKLDADIKNFDLSSISSYVNIFSKGIIKDLKGEINIAANTEIDKLSGRHVFSKITTKNLAIVGKDKAASIIFDDLLTLKLNFDTVNNGIKLNQTSLKSKRIKAYIDGKILNIGKGKTPQLDFIAEVRQTRLEDVVAILPWSEKLLPEFNLYKLKKYVFYGNGQGRVHFKGVAKHPQVNGSISLTDAYLINPIKGAKANASINLKFKGQKMLLDVFVPTTNNQNVTVKGTVKIDGSKYSELNIKSTNAVILDPIQSVLVPLHEILKFQLGPVPIMKITTGVGNIDMHSAGKKVDPHLWGKIQFKNAVASFNDIHNLVLKNGTGEVVFNDTKTTFKTTNGTINGRPVEIKGDCTVLGKLNVFVTSKGHDIPYIVNVINSSPILADVQRVVAPFTQPTGVADIFLNIYGNAKDAEKVKFNEDLFSKGRITLHNASTIMQDTFLPIKNINGIVNFDKYDSDYDVTGFVNNSKIHVKGTGTKSDIDLIATSDKFKIQDCTDLLYPNKSMPYQKEMGLLYASFKGYYKGLVDGNKIDYDKVKVEGKFLPNMSSNDPIKLNGGTFTIKNGKLNSPALKGFFYNNPFTLSFTASNIYDDMKISDAVFNFKNFEVNSINDIKTQLPLPKQIMSQINQITDINGKIDVNGYIKGENIYADTDLSNTNFVYKPINAKVRILSGEAKVRGNTLYLNRINTDANSMPIFINGLVKNIYDNPNFNLSVSAKPTQRFFDLVYNSKAVYPVKIKGDINLLSKIEGTFDALRTRTNLNIGENGSIYYMGATIEGAATGDVIDSGIATNPISIKLDSILYPDRIKINSFNYNQLISSQNKKKFLQNQLNAFGEISILKNNILKFNNFKIKTNHPSNARIFNVLIKKPTIKQGVFTTDLTINGTSLKPNVIGFLNIASVDIPLLESTLRDININFDKNFINVVSKGTILTNDIIANAKILNKTTAPYVIEDLNVQIEELNINTISKVLNDLDADNTRSKKTSVNNQIQVAPKQVIIKNAKLNADKIIIEKAMATNFASTMTLGNDHIFKVDDFHFDLANGLVKGNINYDFNTLNGQGEMYLKNADAELISENFFDMRGQMFGVVNGSMNVACTGLSGVDCVNTLSGSGHFEVLDGRMPKLGSLEYLLKAGNLISGGITGLSVNGIIDLITPLKTGNFEKISGDIKVKNGIANEINIYSKGQDLNMYLTGSYNLSTLVADMEIYGSLSKNFSTLLGKIANASLNRLFNAIPGIAINEINPKSTSNINKIPNFDKANVLRVFKADIYGDINGSNYVKSFKWIRH